MAYVGQALCDFGDVSVGCMIVCAVGIGCHMIAL